MGRNIETTICMTLIFTLLGCAAGVVPALLLAMGGAPEIASHIAWIVTAGAMAWLGWLIA